MRCLCVAILLLANALPLYGEEKWIRLRSANFEVYTPQSEKKARETILYFEQLREFFLDYWRTKADPGTPVRIVLFGNEKQYEPFRPHKTASGYFAHGIDRDWIVISGYLEGWERTVCHEYTHLMVKQAGFELPLWLNEGVAEIYSTFKAMGSKVQIGDLIPGHFYAVQQGWIPVSRLLAVKHDSPEYNGKDTHQFYAEAWGLTHMLMLGQDYRPEFGKIFTQIQNGTASAEALQAGLHMPPDQVDGALRNYLKNNQRFFAGLIPFKSEKSKASFTAERVAAPEIDAVLAELMLASPRNEAKERLAKLNPELWQSQEALAYGAWRAGDTKTASLHFQQAMKLGATSAKLYYDAARATMYAGERNADSVGYLKKAIELYPEWTEARLQLLEQYLFLARYNEALSMASDFKNVSPRHASRLFRGMAYAEAVLGEPGQAKATLERARKYAKGDFEQSECARVDKFLAQVEAGRRSGADSARLVAAQMQAMRERADQAEAAPYGQPGGAIEDLGVATPSARRKGVDVIGTLTDLACEAAKPILTLLTEEGETLQLEIHDPSQVNVAILRPGEEAKKLELSCGVQKKKVAIRYTPAEQIGEDVKLGRLISIEYL